VPVVLEMNHISVHYGKSMALQDVSLNVARGDAVSIIGANGSGKSTILRALCGLTPLSAGEIRFEGHQLNNQVTADIVKLGISLVPEARQLFPYLSVLKNLKLGASLRKNKDHINRDFEKVYQLFPVLHQRQNQMAGTLSGGEQQMVAIARGLMANPKLLCMDEPSLGLAPVVIEQLGQVIMRINTDGMSVLLVEQNIHLALEVATFGYALQVGRVVLAGEIEEIKTSDVVKRAYLGG
jgi:branched-chain amino acid transport system ATP-binding protein